MPRKSFTLRKGTSEGGSYLQYYPTSTSASAGAASATYLRADNIQFAAESNILSSVSFFEGDCFDYSNVRLSWGVTLEEPGELPTPYEVYIVYSPIGHPETILEGQVLINTRTERSFSHAVYDYKWAYYTLFIRYLSNSDDEYYEPVSKLSVLIPTDYGSAADMYARIPSWYQNLDEVDAGEALKKFINIFGWDLDRIRTTLDYMIAMKDPQTAEVETLNNIAKDAGIDLEARELGADRLRKLLDIMGELRRSKGTKGAIERSFTAICGSAVSVNEENRAIYVYAQRCNLVKDPMFVNGVQAGLDGGQPLNNSNLFFDVGYPYTGWTESIPKGGPGYVEYLGTPSGEIGALGYDNGTLFDGGTPGTTTTEPIAGSEQKWISYPDPSTGSFENLETLGADIPVRYGDVFYFSVQQGSSLKPIQSAILSVSFYTYGGLSEGTLIVTDTSPVDINGTRYWKLEIPEEIAAYTRAVLSLTYRPVLGDTLFSYNDFSNVLLERNYVGDYFDGNTKKGGWLVNGMTSISDFRWRDPENPNNSVADTSFSVYTPNYQKTKNVLARLLPDIMPATELITAGIAYSNRPVTQHLKYTILYDVIPGFELA